MHRARDHRIDLGRRLFDLAGHLSDQELTDLLRIPPQTVRACREAAAVKKPTPIKKVWVIERFLEVHEALDVFEPLWGNSPQPGVGEVRS